MRKYSERLIRTIVNSDGHFRWDAEKGTEGGRLVEANIGNIAIVGFAGVDNWDQPYLAYLEKGKATHENRFRLIMTLVDAQHIFLNPDATGFAFPISDVGGVKLYVDNEWGHRCYTVYDNPDYEVTISELQTSETDDDVIEGYTYPQSVSEGDAETARKIIDGSLSVWEDKLVESY